MRSIQRGVATSLILVLFLVIGIAAASGYFIFSQNKQKLAAINSFEECAKLYPVMESYPEQCNTPDGKHFMRELSEEEKERLVPPSAEISSDEYVWKKYENKKYGFEFEYPDISDAASQKSTYANYDYASFMFGCFRAYAGQKEFPKNIEKSDPDIYLVNINEIKNLKEGESKTYPPKGEEYDAEHNFIIRYTLKKLKDKEIAGSNWARFNYSNNWENHAENNVYYLERGENIYLLNVLNGGPCYEDEPIKVLESFKFTN